MNYFERMLNSSLDDNPLEEEVVTESVFPESLPYLVTKKGKVILPKGEPDGKGNICFLYANTYQESIELMNGKTNFTSAGRYKYYFYNPTYIGKIYNKRYRIRDLELRKQIYADVEKKTNVSGYDKLVINGNETRNMYFDLSKFMSIFHSITGSLQTQKRVLHYWSYLKSVINKTSSLKYKKKFILVDVNNFKLTNDLSENLSNPLFMIYYTIYKFPAQKSVSNVDGNKQISYILDDIDIDFYFFSDSFYLKVNPSKLKDIKPNEFKVQMGKLYTHTDKSELIEKATDESQMKKSEVVINSASKINEEINIVDQTDDDNEEKNPLGQDKGIVLKINSKVNEVRKEIEQAVGDISMVDDDLIDRTIKTKVENDINSDKELLNEIYSKTIAPSMPKSAASTARDRELRKQQENLKVGNMTIHDIKKIQTSHVKVPTRNVQNSVKTLNTNMTNITFNNFEKTYNEKVMPKDITNAILSLNDKSIPLFIRNIEVKDTSDELNYKETYTINFEDGNRQRQTIKVDIPKFIEDKFLYIGGNKKLIKKQNFLYPVVKSNEDIVQIVTNYNKMFIQRTDGKSISSIERLKTLLKKSDAVKKYFTFGNVRSINSKYITNVEYDEISKFAIRFKRGDLELYFDQEEALKVKDKIPPEKKTGLFIGKNGTKGIYINDNMRTDDGKSIVDIIYESLSDEEKALYESIRAPKRLMYTRVKVMQQFMAVGLLLGFWEGLSSLLKKADIKYNIVDSISKMSMKPTEDYLQFADCYLVFETDTKATLLLNAFKLIDTSIYPIADMDTREPYMPYLIKVYGRSVISNALLNVYEFMIDPITLEVLNDLNLPTDIVSLVIYAVSLLGDSQYTPEINQNLARIRSNEIVPAILYERLAKNYITYRNSNGRKKFSIPQDCVIKELLALKTVEDYSTLNPILEMEMTHSISSKGFRGANLDESYTMEKRTFDPTMTGVISPSTSPDGSVGVNKTLTLEPSIISIRGYVKDNSKDLDKLKDVNVFSPGELSIPLGATRDDSTRLGHAIKQSKHVIPVKKSSPVLISNGMEEVARFHLSSDFVVNADEDGTIIDYDPETNYMIAKYKSGKTKAIDLNPKIVKNGGGGFFLSNKLITPFKVGDKFKANEVLAYHKDFFQHDKFNNCRMVMGTMTKVGIMSTYNTYQDATMITEKLSEDAATEMCFVKQVSIGKNANIEYIVKKGQEVKVGDSLVQFDTSYDDNSLNALLAALSDDEKGEILAGSRNDVTSKYSGVIEDIKIYATVDVDEMSPSMRKIVKQYYNHINKKKEFLEKYDPESKNSIVKCGVLLNETSKKIDPNKFGVIKGQKVEEGVMIEFYIKHSEPLEIGSKIANFTALKNTIGEIIPAGYEPYSEFRPDEEIGSIIASNSILKRMTPSILLTALGNKCIIELKRKLEDIYNGKK